MKNVVTVIILFIFTYANAQDKFTYSNDGLNPKYQVIQIDSSTKNQIYVKASNWIKETYSNPEQVIKATIENNMIRFEGFKVDAVSIKIKSKEVLYDCKYQIKLSFRDGRYKFEPISVEVVSQPSVVGWLPFDLNNGTLYLSKKEYEPYTIELPKLINELNTQLYSYLNSTDDDW